MELTNQTDGTPHPRYPLSFYYDASSRSYVSDYLQVTSNLGLFFSVDSPPIHLT